MDEGAAVCRGAEMRLDGSEISEAGGGMDTGQRAGGMRRDRQETDG